MNHSQHKKLHRKALGLGIGVSLAIHAALIGGMTFSAPALDTSSDDHADKLNGDQPAIELIRFAEAPPAAPTVATATAAAAGGSSAASAATSSMLAVRLASLDLSSPTARVATVTSAKTEPITVSPVSALEHIRMASAQAAMNDGSGEGEGEEDGPGWLGNLLGSVVISGGYCPPGSYGQGATSVNQRGSGLPFGSE